MFEQPELMVMCGLSGSGKSYYAKYLNEFKNENEIDRGCHLWPIIVSSDDIREEICPGGVDDQSMNEEVFRIFHERVRENLEKGQHVIADATFLTIKDRKKLLDSVKGIDCWKSIIIVPTPFRLCLYRNSNRERKVPEEVIYRQRAKFQIPFEEEGWDYIHYPYSIDNYGGWEPWNDPAGDYIDDDIRYNLGLFDDVEDATYWLRKMFRFNQGNPHHKDSLLVHSMKVAEKFSVRYPRFTEMAILHDIGKFYTKTIDDNNICHYFNHENVGAYEVLSMEYIQEEYSVDWGSFHEEIFLINYHMLPFGWKTDKAKEKWRRIFGDKKFQMLMDFHECDKGD